MRPPPNVLEMTNLILCLDPLERGLSSPERTRRVVRAYQQAVERLQAAPRNVARLLPGQQPITELQTTYARRCKIRPRVRETGFYDAIPTS